ncbi:MAG: MarR family transcriptional regulator [Anaerolineales bacterium]|jgi:DNA-binding MarR family transcriptional regulator
MPNNVISNNQVIERTLDKFWETVPPLWGTIRAHIRAVATDNFDISVEQFHILRNIRGGCHSVSKLAQTRNISRPAVSQGVDALVTKGMVTRTQSKADRRRVELELSPEGNALLDHVFQNTRNWMKSTLESFSQEELELADRGMDVLKKMTD